MDFRKKDCFHHKLLNFLTMRWFHRWNAYTIILKCRLSKFLIVLSLHSKLWTFRRKSHRKINHVLNQSDSCRKTILTEPTLEQRLAISDDSSRSNDAPQVVVSVCHIMSYWVISQNCKTMWSTLSDFSKKNLRWNSLQLNFTRLNHVLDYFMLPQQLPHIRCRCSVHVCQKVVFIRSYRLCLFMSCTGRCQMNRNFLPGFWNIRRRWGIVGISSSFIGCKYDKKRCAHLIVLCFLQEFKISFI